jgi:hypothetical protein
LVTRRTIDAAIPFSRRRLLGVYESSIYDCAYHSFRVHPALLSLIVGIGVANAQKAAPPETPAALNTIDFNFVGQANLGAPFQVDSCRLAKRRAAPPPFAITLT